MAWEPIELNRFVVFVVCQLGSGEAKAETCSSGFGCCSLRCAELRAPGFPEFGAAPEDIGYTSRSELTSPPSRQGRRVLAELVFDSGSRGHVMVML